MSASDLFPLIDSPRSKEQKKTKKKICTRLVFKFLSLLNEVSGSDSWGGERGGSGKRGS